MGIFRSSIKALESKLDYKVLHNQYSDAVAETIRFAEANGFTVDDDEYAEQIGFGPTKPKEGKTNRFSMTLFKDEKPQKKMLQIQITGVHNKYELNMYIL